MLGSLPDALRIGFVGLVLDFGFACLLLSGLQVLCVCKFLFWVGLSVVLSEVVGVVWVWVCTWFAVCLLGFY